MNNRTLAWASGILMVAVLFGAFGAHTLKDKISIEAISNWNTGVQYMFYHGLALLALAALDARFPAKSVILVRACFIAGVVLFCGSLFMLATREIMGTQALSPVLGPITPLGGLCFIGGWVLLLRAALSKG